MLRKYERELKRLRAELEERSRNLVDKRQLLFVEGERRRAEADKMAAIRALEVRIIHGRRSVHTLTCGPSNAPARQSAHPPPRRGL